MGQTGLSRTHRTWVRLIWDGMDMVGLGSLMTRDLQDLGKGLWDRQDSA